MLVKNQSRPRDSVDEVSVVAKHKCEIGPCHHGLTNVLKFMSNFPVSSTSVFTSKFEQ